MVEDVAIGEEPGVFVCFVSINVLRFTRGL